MSLRINDGEPKRSSTIKSLEPLWNEQLQLSCARGDTLHVEVYDDDSMRKVKSPAYSQLQGRASLRVGELRAATNETRVLKLTGGPGAPTLSLTLLWRALDAASFSSHESQLRVSLAQMRHELALSRAEKASWENSSGHLRSYGVLAPEAARTRTVHGIAAAEVFANAKHPPDQPRRQGVIPTSEMRVRPDVAAAVAKAYGHKDFHVISQSASTGGVDVVVGPGRQAESYSTFQQQWKARARLRACPPACCSAHTSARSPGCVCARRLLRARRACRTAGRGRGACGQEGEGLARLPYRLGWLQPAVALWWLQEARGALLLMFR